MGDLRHCCCRARRPLRLAVSVSQSAICVLAELVDPRHTVAHTDSDAPYAVAEGDDPAVWLVEQFARLTSWLVRRWGRHTRYDVRVTGGVTNASSELIAALARARRLIAQQDSEAPAMINGSTVPHSRPPWNAQVAHTVYGVSEAARRLEAVVRREVSGSIIARGGSDENTDASIVALDALSAALPTKEAREITRSLSGWTTRLLRLKAIDEAVTWLPIRTQTLCGDCGTPLDMGVCPACGWVARPPRCPYCKTMHLRRADRAFVVMCFYPGCEDRDGNSPPFARLDISAITHRAILAWSDGLVEGG